nr:hypothetical protein [uncultured Sphingomonas sp.]
MALDHALLDLLAAAAVLDDAHVAIAAAARFTDRAALPLLLLLRALGPAFNADVTAFGTTDLPRPAAARFALGAAAIATGLLLSAAIAADLLATAVAAHLLLAATADLLLATAAAGLLAATIAAIAARLLAAAASAALNLGGRAAALAAAAAALAGLRQDRRSKGQRRGAGQDYAVLHEPWLLSEANNGSPHATVPNLTGHAARLVAPR